MTRADATRTIMSFLARDPHTEEPPPFCNFQPLYCPCDSLSRASLYLAEEPLYGGMLGVKWAT
jgi:hypothetical protein